MAARAAVRKLRDRLFRYRVDDRNDLALAGALAKLFDRCLNGHDSSLQRVIGG